MEGSAPTDQEVPRRKRTKDDSGPRNREPKPSHLFEGTGRDAKLAFRSAATEPTAAGSVAPAQASVLGAP